MNKVAISFSTKDRVELSQQSITSLRQAQKIDLFVTDGSRSPEGQAFAAAQADRTIHTHRNVYGGADAAIAFNMTALLEHPNNYDFVGLCENDVLLPQDFAAPDNWFDRTMALFGRGECDGLEVGAVSARCYDDRILIQRDGYALMHNLGAGMVIWSRKAAQIALANFRTGWTTDNRSVFAQLCGIDIGRYWAFRANLHALCADWHIDTTLAAHGLASLALTPSPAQMIGQVPPLAQQGLRISDKPVEERRDDAAFDLYRDRTRGIREREWMVTTVATALFDANVCAWAWYPHHLKALGAVYSGDWRLKWTQGMGPFSWRAGGAGAVVEIPVFGPATAYLGGGPDGGRIRITDPATNYSCDPRLVPETGGDQNQVMSLVLPAGMHYRTVRLEALDPGVTFYALQTRERQPRVSASGFTWHDLPTAE